MSNQPDSALAQAASTMLHACASQVLQAWDDCCANDGTDDLLVLLTLENMNVQIAPRETLLERMRLSRAGWETHRAYGKLCTPAGAAEPPLPNRECIWVVASHGETMAIFRMLRSRLADAVNN